MSLIKWNQEPGLFPQLATWVNDLFSEDWPLPAVKGISIPAVNITEAPDAFNLKLAAPGYRKEDFKLAIENGSLFISAETKEEKEEKTEKFTRREYSFGSFSRSFTLPENVKRDQIAAEYKNGVLNVKLPKVETQEKPKLEIAVK
jgi:HSP20 family protein